MKKKYLLLIGAILVMGFRGLAQIEPMTMEQYTLAVEATINDLDKDTYLKLNNEFVLDRYQMKPAYFIAGSEGTKNRVDLYSFIQRQDMEMLGLLMIYTNQTSGKESKLCLPLAAENEVWAKYYDDLKYGSQDDPAFGFAIGSVVSRELSNLLKSGGESEDYSVESSDYDICFPGDTPILMADESSKPIATVEAGDWVASVKNGRLVSSKVKSVESHFGRYQFVNITVQPDDQLYAGGSKMLNLISLTGTNNHPIHTTRGLVPLSNIKRGDKVFLEGNSGITKAEVLQINAFTRESKVYNLRTESGSYLANGIWVGDKSEVR